MRNCGARLWWLSHSKRCLRATDDRTKQHRAKASSYRNLILKLTQEKKPYEDHASQYKKIDLSLRKAITPRPHQSSALQAWLESKEGVVVLPTGAGKTTTPSLLSNQA